MHEHDLDLIAALADGSLDDDTEALALVESCPECRAEYEGHVAVIRLLASTPAAEMTEVERAALHRDLWTELRAAPARPSSSPWWYRWAYVAAGLFVVVGLVSVLNGGIWFGAGDSGGVESASDVSDSAGDEGGGEVPLAGVAEDGAERATTTAAAAAESLPYPFSDYAEEARAKRQSGDISTLSDGDDYQECLTLLGLDSQEVVDRLDLDQAYLLLMPADDEVGETVTFVALGECRIAYVDG